MTIDSNILIAYLSGELAVVQGLSHWKEAGTSFFLPTIVEAEVLSFAGWNHVERNNVEMFLEYEFVSVPFDRIASRIAAKIRRERAIKLPDAAIAATALYTRTALVTRNVRDFRNIHGLEVLSL